MPPIGDPPPIAAEQAGVFTAAQASLTFPGTVVSHHTAATLLGWPVPAAGPFTSPVAEGRDAAPGSTFICVAWRPPTCSCSTAVFW